MKSWVINNEIDKVRDLLSSSLDDGFDINEEYKGDKRLLDYALEAGHLDMAHMLLEKGAISSNIDLLN